MGRHGQVLDSAKIVSTIDVLRARIHDRFPNSGLARVCAELSDIARRTDSRVDALARPYYGLRFLAFLVVILGIAAQVFAAQFVDWRKLVYHADANALTQSLD